jgi:hypothetical protein
VRLKWKASVQQREEANREYFKAQREARQQKMKSAREQMIESKKVKDVLFLFVLKPPTLSLFPRHKWLQ